MKVEPAYSLKDQLFNAEKVTYLSGLLAQADPDFNRQEFEHQVLVHLPDLALKERIAHIAACLHAFLPAEYPAAVDILRRSLPPALDPGQTDNDFGDFILAPHGHFVAEYGCSEPYLDLSLATLREMTKRFSAEGPVRSFINAFPDQTLEFLIDCAGDENYHVRRWASEGTRPKLPWAQKLVIDYTRPLPILEKLYADPTRYVTRSVANHLNDIAKIDPALVVEMLARWRASGRQKKKEMAYIVRHATRTLIKQGDPGALALLGFDQEPDITVAGLKTTTPEVVIGDSFEFSLTIEAHKQQKLVVDYLLNFAGDGRPGGQKIFKLKTLEMKKGEKVKISKAHRLRPMTTRRLYPGAHRLTLQINGQPYGTLEFKLTH